MKKPYILRKMSRIGSAGVKGEKKDETLKKIPVQIPTVVSVFRASCSALPLYAVFNTSI